MPTMSMGESYVSRRDGWERGGSQTAVRDGRRTARSPPDEAARQAKARTDGVAPVPTLTDGVAPIPLWGSETTGAGGTNEGGGGLVVWRAGVTTESSASLASVVPAGNGTNDTFSTNGIFGPTLHEESSSKT